MDISGDEENSLYELVLTVQGKPHVNELLWQRLDKLRNVKIDELLFLEDDIGLSCLGRFPELIGIRRLISHPSELVSSLHRSVSAAVLIEGLVLILFLELFLSSGFNNSFD